MTSVLALVGSGVIAAVAYVGHRYKKAMDEQNILLKQSEEERQRLNTFVESIGLLSTKDGNDVSEPQRGAVLLILAKIHELPFALNLLRVMWVADAIDASTAVWLIDTALATSAEDPQNPILLERAQSLHNQAAILLHDNAERLYLPNGSYVWPSSLDSKWNPTLPDEAREYLLAALMKIVTNRESASWNTSYLGGALIDLYCIAKQDSDPCVRVAAANAALFVTRVAADQCQTVFLPGRQQPTNLADVEDELGSLIVEIEGEYGDNSRPTTDLEELLEKMEAWSNGSEKGSKEESEDAERPEEGNEEEGGSEQGSGGTEEDEEGVEEGEGAKAEEDGKEGQEAN